jgi:bacterioferritin-associated ferredoxin
MACNVRPAPAQHLAQGIEPMTRCECLEIAFEAIAERVARECLSFDEIRQRTGCGSVCSACLPDLERYLGSR